ncbi:MAG: DUF454 domain-containing protein [Clostridiales bacterium]|nr:DUF454 domain-containing protein [Clostridiales bacterium]
MKKIILLISGWLLIAVAAVGVLLPVLPTTPFVILAALCFSFSSERLYKLLLGNRIFGPYIENYRTKQGVSAVHKARAIITLWVLLIISAGIARVLWVTLLLAAVGLGVTTHLLLIKTKKNLPDITETQEQDA